MNTATFSADPSAATDPWQRAVELERAGDLVGAARAYVDCPPEPARGAAPAHFQAGWCLERAQQTERALAQYRQAVAQSGEASLTVEALFRAAWIALQGHDSDSARRDLSSLVEIAEANAVGGATVCHARYWLAFCIETEGQLLEAARRYAPLVAQGNPDLWHEAAYRRLLCLSQAGDLDGAFDAATPLLSAAHPVTDPQRLRVLQELAREEQTQILRARAAA